MSHACGCVGFPDIQIWKQFITAHVLINVVLLINAVLLLSRFRKTTKDVVVGKNALRGHAKITVFVCARLCVCARALRHAEYYRNIFQWSLQMHWTHVIGGRFLPTASGHCLNVLSQWPRPCLRNIRYAMGLVHKQIIFCDNMFHNVQNTVNIFILYAIAGQTKNHFTKVK